VLANEKTLLPKMIKADSILRATRNFTAAIIPAFLFLGPTFAATESGVILVEPARVTEPGGSHISKDLNGALQTSENMTLRLNTDLGSVRILPLERGAVPEVRYSVHIETDARGTQGSQLLGHYVLSVRNTAAGVEITGNLPQQLARGTNNAQFWIRYEISVPASYSLDVTTGAGDISTADVGGTARLITEGGNIITGRIAGNSAQGMSRRGTKRFAAKLQTQGGHIQLDDVKGDLTAFTAGGHINTGFISGEANLHSGGGHIRSAGIGGKAQLATEGGNITVGKAGNFVAVKTGGGQIDFGEVRGSVHAMTGGGGIRVMYVSGPMDVESNGGSICLTRVSGAVKAATGSGTITAWINPDGSMQTASSVRLSGASQLTSGAGDIVVFLPRNLAANIEAVVESGGEHRIEADPALALQIEPSAQSSGQVRAAAELNGGGPMLRLKTTGGRIKLQYLEAETALWDSMVREQKVRMERDLSKSSLPAMPAMWPEPAMAPEAPPRAEPATPTVTPVAPSVWTGSWVDKLELHILGGVREDGDAFQSRIVSAPRPAYPDVARKAGIEGRVRLQVRLTQDGNIEVQKLLEGDTVLADAAIAAVKKWRGKPVWMDGKPVDVISTVTFEFHLR
jgi:TonB family protein